MTKDYSPFTPGKPVDKELFVGRKEEVEFLKRKAEQSTEMGMQTIFLAGERGIGKSSLASFAKDVIEKESKLLGIYTSLGGINTIDKMVAKIIDRFVKDNYDKSIFEGFKGSFNKYIRQVGLFGINVEFKPPEKDIASIADNFGFTLQELTDKIKNEKRGILLILDDINGLASSRKFANWIKSFVDETAVSRTKLPLCLLFVGLEERRQSLIDLQPSLVRVFDLLEISNWTDEETEAFYREAFGKVNVSIRKDALDIMVQFTGGLPVFAHEIGDAVFRIDDDDKINIGDAKRGIMLAAVIIGRKYVKPGVLNSIQSKHYLSILRKVGAGPFEFKRKDLLSNLNKNEREVLDKFLNKMKKLGVIRAVPESGRGIYCFQNRLYHAYLFMEAGNIRKR